jgi:drug/metabolite transporter (DMT)-like permease
LWTKVALRGLSPTQIVIGQLTTGAAVLVTAVILRHQPLPRATAQWAHLAVMAMVGSIAPYLLFSWGEQHVASSLAGVLNATTPLLTLLFVMATRSEHASMTRVSGIGLGFVGVVVLAAPWRNPTTDGSVAGIAACLLAATCYAAGNVYARRFLAGRGFRRWSLQLASSPSARSRSGWRPRSLPARQPRSPRVSLSACWCLGC